MARTVIPEREREICHRLTLWRECVGLTRVRMAKLLSVKVEWLASYEYGRAPIRYEVAARLIGGTFINPIWLATGKGSMRPRETVHLPLPEAIGISPRDLFSEVYDKHLRSSFEADQRLLAPSGDTRAAFAESMLHIESKVTAESLLNRHLHRWIREVSTKELAHFVTKLIEYGDLLHKGSSKITRSERAFIEQEMMFLAGERLNKRKRKSKAAL